MEVFPDFTVKSKSHNILHCKFESQTFIFMGILLWRITIWINWLLYARQNKPFHVWPNENPYGFIPIVHCIIHVRISLTLFALVRTLVYMAKLWLVLKWSSLAWFAHENPTVPDQNSGAPFLAGNPGTNNLGLLPRHRRSHCAILVIAIKSCPHHSKCSVEHWLKIIKVCQKQQFNKSLWAK